MAIPFILAGAAIAAAGFGAKKGYDGYQDKSFANSIIEDSKEKYEASKLVFDEVNEEAEKSLTKLGELQLRVGTSFSEFQTLADSLLQKINKSSGEKVVLSIPQHQLDKIEQLSISAVNYMGKVAGAGVVGAASAYAVYGGVMAFAAASTGTSISALSGVAAYNATLAAIGGGSLATGGLGMAGGTMILGGVVAAPIIAIAGWAFASHAEEALSDAYKAREEVDEAVIKLEIAGNKLKETISYIEEIFSSTEDVFYTFMGYFNTLKQFDKHVKEGADIDKIEDDIINIVENGFAIASILTDIITTPLFVAKADSEGNICFEDDAVVIEKDEYGMNVLNLEGIEASLERAKA